MRDGKQMCQDFEDFIRQRYVVHVCIIIIPVELVWLHYEIINDNYNQSCTQSPGTRALPVWDWIEKKYMVWLLYSALSKLRCHFCYLGSIINFAAYFAAVNSSHFFQELRTLLVSLKLTTILYKYAFLTMLHGWY